MTKGEIPNSNTPPRPRHREEDSKCVKLTKHNWRESTTKQQESEQHLSNFSNGTLCMVTSSSEGLLRPIYAIHGSCYGLLAVLREHRQRTPLRLRVHELQQLRTPPSNKLACSDDGGGDDGAWRLTRKVIHPLERVRVRFGDNSERAGRCGDDDDGA